MYALVEYMVYGILEHKEPIQFTSWSCLCRLWLGSSARDSIKSYKCYLVSNRTTFACLTKTQDVLKAFLFFILTIITLQLRGRRKNTYMEVFILRHQSDARQGEWIITVPVNYKCRLCFYEICHFQLLFLTVFPHHNSLTRPTVSGEWEGMAQL